MKLIAQINSKDQLGWVEELGCEAVLVCSSQHSQEGGLSTEEQNDILGNLSKTNVDVSILFDRRIQEGSWVNALDLLEKTPGVPRVLDLGMARALEKEGRVFDLDLQIGHLNDRAVMIWAEKFSSLRRISLNPQMPRRQLLPLLEELDVQTEILGFGPIAMYHTPRKLLSWSGVEGETHIRSEEMGAGAYPMTESNWGSTLYYNKTLSLLPHRDELKAAGMNFFRIDLRKMNSEEVEHFKEGFIEGKDIRAQYPGPLLHGFYGENKSDSLLGKIGGKRSDVTRKVLGEVLDVKGRHLLVRCLADDFKKGLEVVCEDGKGLSHNFVFEGGKGLGGGYIEHPDRGTLIKLMAPRKFPVGTFLYDLETPEG